MKRLFFAFPVSDEVREVLAAVQEKIRKHMKHSKISWVAPENFHITIHFLGEVDEEQAEDLQLFMREIEMPKPFTAELTELTAQPSVKTPQTIWVQTKLFTEAFGVHARIAKVLAHFGYPIDARPWKPHITLGRVRVQSEVLQPEKAALEPLSFRIDTFAMYESRRKEDGSKVYDVIESYTL